MARIKIKDLPKDSKIGKEEMKKVLGGVLLSTSNTISYPGQEKMGVEPSPFVNLKTTWAEPALA